MIGTSAVTGGLTGMAVVCIAAMLGFTGVAVGAAALKRHRPVAGVVALASGVVVVAWAATLLWKALIPTESSLTVRVEPSNAEPLLATAHQCVAVMGGMNCFANADITHLTLAFPEGRQETVVARSMYTETKENSLRKIAFMSPHATTVSDLLDVIDEQLARGPSGDPEAWAKARTRLIDSTARHGDQYLVFSHKGYDIMLWVLPREANSDRIAYWYEIYPRLAP